MAYVRTFKGSVCEWSSDEGVCRLTSGLKLPELKRDPLGRSEDPPLGFTFM